MRDGCPGQVAWRVACVAPRLSGDQLNWCLERTPTADGDMVALGTGRSPNGSLMPQYPKGLHSESLHEVPRTAPSCPCLMCGARRAAALCPLAEREAFPKQVLQTLAPGARHLPIVRVSRVVADGVSERLLRLFSSVLSRFPAFCSQAGLKAPSKSFTISFRDHRGGSVPPVDCARCGASDSASTQRLVWGRACVRPPVGLIVTASKRLDSAFWARVWAVRVRPFANRASGAQSMRDRPLDVRVLRPASPGLVP